MIKARLMILLPSDTIAEAANSPWGTRVLWDKVALHNCLPTIADRVPDIEELIWFGQLKDGIFFVRELTLTKSGLTCQIDLCPNGSRNISPSEWTRQNFFHDQPGNWVRCGKKGNWLFFPQETKVSFALEDLRQV